MNVINDEVKPFFVKDPLPLTLSNTRLRPVYLEVSDRDNLQKSFASKLEERSLKIKQVY